VQVITRVPNATADEMQSAVDAAKEAYKSWSKTSILTRQQVMFKYQDIIRKNMVGLSWFDKKQTIILFSQRELAESVTLEQGKTLADAEGDVLRGLRKLFFRKIYVKSIRSVVN
jgi:malonate-semialdehyde dehydrogenase (acetylating) / methylmalonate-semialdehyde dehydrogenase